ncbi:hypothetical protein GCM10009789_36640 [Kribbella sancticallisti]|uniref:CHAT domain-containing protein n=1 Tax=Kribbella sancticallisti TaxID=460087 RepID=A0ABP4PF57_9ACTN
MGDSASLSAVLDIATGLTTRARIATRRDREQTWYKLARSANRRLGTGADTDALEVVRQCLWVPEYAVPELTDDPAIAVRSFLVRALADPAEALPALTSAVDALDELPTDDDFHSRDAALRAISGQSLQLSEKVIRDASQATRDLLGESLTTAAEESTTDVRTLTEVVRAMLSGDDEPLSVPDRVDQQAAAAQRSIRTLIGDVTKGLDLDTQQRVRHGVLDHEPAQVDVRRKLGYIALAPVMNLLADDSRQFWMLDRVTELVDSYGDKVGEGLDKAGEFADEKTGARYDDEIDQRADFAGDLTPEPTGLDQLNVGLAEAARPMVPLAQRSVRPSSDYLVWTSIGPPDPDALPDPMAGIDLSRMVAGDTLEVVLFGANGNDQPPTGTFLLGSGRPLHVGAPADDVDVPEHLQQTRLYFRIRTPDQPGQMHLRLCLYHHSTLLRVHHLILHIGKRTARFEIRTPYAIAGSPTSTEVGRLANRRLSIYTNTTGDGTHDFFFHADDGETDANLSASFDGLEVQNLLRMIRGSLRTAAWGEDAAPRRGAYKYGQQRDGSFGTSFSVLRDDLVELARNGYDAWEDITSRLGGPRDRETLQRRMRRPGGIVDIAPRADSVFVPPMAGLYDLNLDTDRNIDIAFCPEAEDTLRSRTPLTDTTCFGPEGCRHADDETVCPSGFWGLRHDIGVPVSDTTDENVQPRLDVGLGGSRGALIGTVPEQVVTGVTAHAQAVVTRLPGSIHVTDRNAWFTEAARPATYPILYFLCHGEDRPRGGPVLVLDRLGRPGISRSNLTAKKVALSHQPLVVMNACDTAALEPERAISLVKGFTYNGAGAVVGTEITIFTSLAYGFALTFLDAVLAGNSLGSALRTSRLELLRMGNPLGLAYILYGLPDARMNPTPDLLPSA